MPVKLFKIPIFLFLSSCIGGSSGSSGGAFNSQVSVRVVSQFSDSFLRTPSGRPYIRLQGGPPRICRKRPFTIEAIREELLAAGVTHEILNDYLFSGEAEGEEGETGEGGEGETSENTRPGPVFHNIGSNWIEFGLLIQNNTDFALIINLVRLSGAGRCGRVFTYPNSEIGTGYCSSGEAGSFPILYIVPPRRQVVYRPDDTNPFHNLTLRFSGFEIDDRRNTPSKRLQRIISGPTATNNTQQNSSIDNDTLEEVCEPNREDYAIPKYTLELSLLGYFIGLSSEFATVDFFKRINFDTEVIY